MRYQVVRWIHDHPHEPELFYSEVDSSGVETRRVEWYLSGRWDVAGGGLNVGQAVLAPVLMEPVGVVNALDGFDAREMNASEFEEIWKAALESLAEE
jgi:hypothetical protein